MKNVQRNGGMERGKEGNVGRWIVEWTNGATEPEPETGCHFLSLTLTKHGTCTLYRGLPYSCSRSQYARNTLKVKGKTMESKLKS